MTSRLPCHRQVPELGGTRPRIGRTILKSKHRLRYGFRHRCVTIRPPTVGEMLAAISTRIVQLLRENYGRGPSRAKSYAMDDCIVCVLRNGFTRHERTIVEGGDPSRVIAMRQEFQRLMERQYRETIETITGRRVVAFLSQAHLEPDITLEIFFLDRPMDGAAALNLDLPAADRYAAKDRA